MHRIRLSEDRGMRNILWPKWNKITGDMRKLHHEELHHPYSSSNIVREIKSGRMRWTRRIESRGEKRSTYVVLMGKPEGKCYLEDLGIDGAIILEEILKK